MPGQSYSRDFTLSMVAYALFLVFSIEMLNSFHFPKVGAALIGLVPMLPLVWTMKTVIDHFHSLDELQRRIQSEALVFAFAATAVVVLSYGFLQSSIDAPPILWMWVWPVQAVTWMLGAALARRRYR